MIVSNSVILPVSNCIAAHPSLLLCGCAVLAVLVLVEFGEYLLAHGEEVVDVEHVLGVVLLDKVPEHVELVAQALSRVPDDAVVPESSWKSQSDKNS